MKPAVFHPAARNAIRSFPEEVRRELGKAIFDLQRGESLAMPLSRPMPSVAGGVAELRIRDRSGDLQGVLLRCVVAGILVFHAFVKKSRETPKQELDTARKRLKELLDEEI